MHDAGRPVLGITCCTRHVGDESAQAVIDRYVEASARYADCAALLVPARPDLMAAEEVADRLDGLLLTGSPSNVAPARYDSPAPAQLPLDAGRDAMALALAAAMIARGRPVFGLCRGFQELNVALGGTLHGDLGASCRELAHHAPDDAGLEAMFGHVHPVALVPGGVLARALRRDALTVTSVHYQGIDRLAAALHVEATAPDGVIEAAAALIGDAPVLGVQWHPEWRAAADPSSRDLFALLGRALRGDRSAWKRP